MRARSIGMRAPDTDDPDRANARVRHDLRRRARARQTHLRQHPAASLRQWQARFTAPDGTHVRAATTCTTKAQASAWLPTGRKSDPPRLGGPCAWIHDLRNYTLAWLPRPKRSPALEAHPGRHHIDEAVFTNRSHRAPTGPALHVTRQYARTKRTCGDGRPQGPQDYPRHLPLLVDGRRSRRGRNCAESLGSGLADPQKFTSASVARSTRGDAIEQINQMD